MSHALKCGTMYEAFAGVCFRAHDIGGHDWNIRAAVSDADLKRIEALCRQLDALGWGKIVDAAAFSIGFEHRSLGSTYHALRINQR